MSYFVYFGKYTYSLDRCVSPEETFSGSLVILFLSRFLKINKTLEMSTKFKLNKNNAINPIFV